MKRKRPLEGLETECEAIKRKKSFENENHIETFSS